MPLLDVRSIALACDVTHLAIAIALTYVWLGRKTYAGFGTWTLSTWSAFAGILLLAGRGLIPDLYSVLIANLLLLGTSSLLLSGLLAFCGERPNHQVHAGLLLYGLLIAFLTFVRPSLQARLVVFSLGIGFLTLLAAYIAWKRLPAVLHDANPLVISTLSFVGSVYLARGILSWIVPPPTENFLDPSPIQGMSLLVYLLGHTVLSAGLLVLNAQRVERDLQVAMDECKVLQGILPICAHCKKIRDDRGAWNQLEAYIHQHTDAEFSHGICPDCARTFYEDRT